LIRTRISIANALFKGIFMPIIFVSHAAVDAKIANLFKEKIEGSFLGLCDLFVSSNLDSINAGVEWHQTIKRNLSESVILIGLLSPVAVTRGWVYCEFGAGWIRNIPVIPLCHSGLTRDNLPPPLSLFQGLNLTESPHLRHLYTQIAETLGCRLPQIDFDNLAAEFKDISDTKRISELLRGWLQQLLAWNPELEKLFQDADTVEEVLIPAHLDQAFEEFRNESLNRGYLRVENKGFGMGTRVGSQASIFSVSRGPNFEDVRGFLGVDLPTVKAGNDRSTN
jgi:hypothetical protein